MFQCYSLKSSHPCLLPQSLKVCSLHLCLFCCLAYRIIIITFLNFIYICNNIQYWCFSFWLTSLCMLGSSFIHLIRTDSNVFLSITELYFIGYMYNFLIHSFSNGHLGCFHVLAIVNSAAMNIAVHEYPNSGFLSVYAQQCNHWVICNSVLERQTFQSKSGEKT